MIAVSNWNPSDPKKICLILTKIMNCLVHVSEVVSLIQFVNRFKITELIIMWCGIFFILITPSSSSYFAVVTKSFWELKQSTTFFSVALIKTKLLYLLVNWHNFKLHGRWLNLVLSARKDFALSFSYLTSSKYYNHS